MRALPLVLVALLVLAPVAGASAFSTGSGSQSPVGTADATAASNHTFEQTTSNETAINRTARVLTLPQGEIQRSTTENQHVDLGPAIGFATNASDQRIETLTVIEEVERVESARGRTQRLAAALDTIEQRTAALREREQAAIQAYGEGETTPRAFLIDLARIDAEASALDDRRARLIGLADGNDDVDIDRGRTAALERRLQALRGPVREHAREVLQGQQPTNRFFVATGPDSLVLATITEDTYVREAYRGDRYNPGGGGDIGPQRALEITAESYPLLWELRQDNTDVIGSNGNYLVRMPHERGSLEAFVDGESRAVYKEFQTRPLASFEHARTTTATRDGLGLTANYTYPGGPVRIRLVDAESGAPENANVTISERGQESELLGRSGRTGTLWTLAPQGEYTVTAIRGNDVVVLTVAPIQPPRAGRNASTTERASQNESTTVNESASVAGQSVVPHAG
jgi:hypothetical protein